MGYFNLLRKFDRTYSTKTLYQLLWLVFFLLLTFVVMWIIAAIVFEKKSFLTDYNNFHQISSLFDYVEFVAAIMLDPGQIDHIKEGPEHQWGLLLGLLGVIAVTGLTISTITNIVQRRVNQYLNGEVRYHFNKHVVIIGLGKLAMSIIDQICKDSNYNKKDILVMTTQKTNEARQVVNTIVDKKDESRIYYYRGRKDSKEDLLSLCIENADEVFIIGENDEINRDASNMEALQKIAETPKRLKSEIDKLSFFSIRKLFLLWRYKQWEKHKTDKLPVTVLLDFQTTFAAFQLTDISKKWRDYIDFRPFNFYENWAKKLIYTKKYLDINRKPIYYPSIDEWTEFKSDPLSGQTIKETKAISYNSNKYVHIVIFSMSRMGVALGTFVAQVCHFPNFIRDKKYKTRITFITPEADTEKDFFRGRYSRFFEVASSSYRDYIKGDGSEVELEPTRKDMIDLLDIRFEFINGKAEQPEIRRLLTEWAIDKEQILSLAICQKDASKNMAIGLYLPDIIYQKQIPIFIRQKSTGALLTLLREDKIAYHKYQNVYPFGMQEDCYDLGNEDRLIAQLFNSFYYDIFESYNSEKQITKGDLRKLLNKKWSDLQIAHQWSNLYAVYSVPFKLNSLSPLRSIGYPNKIDYSYYSKFLCCEKNELCELNVKSDETNMMAEVEHNRWNVEKLLLGYRVYTEEERQEDKRLEEDFENSMKDIMQATDSSIYSKIEYIKNQRVENEQTSKYKTLKSLRKYNENSFYSHNAIRPYKKLDEGNQRYDLFMTGNIPKIFQLLEMLNNQNINEDEKVYPLPN